MNKKIGGTVAKKCKTCGGQFYAPAGSPLDLCSVCVTGALTARGLTKDPAKKKSVIEHAILSCMGCGRYEEDVKKNGHSPECRLGVWARWNIVGATWEVDGQAVSVDEYREALDEVLREMNDDG